MSHHMTLPTSPLTSGLIGQASTATRKLTAKDTAPTSGPSTGTPTAAAANSTSSLDTTFLSLLVQELQNQDPTAPMDSTAMVGQMISLNQLDQLTSINQTLSTAYPGSTTAPAAAPSGKSIGASGGATGGATADTPTGTGALTATQAALRLLSANSTAFQPAVSPSVTLPAF